MVAKVKIWWNKLSEEEKMSHANNYFSTDDWVSLSDSKILLIYLYENPIKIDYKKPIIKYVDEKGGIKVTKNDAILFAEYCVNKYEEETLSFEEQFNKYFNIE
jgi:hypothetical protein